MFQVHVQARVLIQLFYMINAAADFKHWFRLFIKVIVQDQNII